MSTEREELARDIPTWTNLPFGGLGHVKLDANAAYAIAGVLIEKGYRKPQQVTTVEELDALPDESIILDARGLCREGLRTMGSGNVWRAMGPAQVLRSMEIALPATVLHVGGAE